MSTQSSNSQFPDRMHIPEVDTNTSSDSEGARIGIEIGRVLQNEPLAILNKMSMDNDVRDGSPLFGYIMNMTVAAKMARSYGGHAPETIHTPNIMNEFQSRMLTMQHQSLGDFHNIFYGLSLAHGQSLDEFSDSFESLIEKNTQYLFKDMLTIANAGELIKDGTGNHDNLTQFAQRLRMFETGFILTGKAGDPEYTTKMYDMMRSQLLGRKEGQHPLVEPLSIEYALEVAKEKTNMAKLKKIRNRRPDLAQSVVDRAALDVLLSNSHGRMTQIQEHAPEAREYLRSAIAAIKGTDLLGIYKDYTAVMKRMEAYSQRPKAQDAEPILDITALDWEVLPPGELRDIAQDIVDKASKPGKPVTIDLDRLKILENIRESWGNDRTFYAKGTLGHRGIVKDGELEAPDQYLMLILQELDHVGTVVAEHAIAESPIAGPHAMYVFRQDVSEGLSWREVMALAKVHARELGARPVKHTRPTSNGDMGLVDTMTIKAELLMSCTPEEFKIAEFNGERGIRLPKTLITIAN